MRGARDNNFPTADVAQTLSLLRPDSSGRSWSTPGKRPDESGRGRHECPRHIAHADDVKLLLHGSLEAAVFHHNPRPGTAATGSHLRLCDTTMTYRAPGI
jgi:hypothetical protein